MWIKVKKIPSIDWNLLILRFILKLLPSFFPGENLCWQSEITSVSHIFFPFPFILFSWTSYHCPASDLTCRSWKRSSWCNLERLALDKADTGWFQREWVCPLFSFPDKRHGKRKKKAWRRRPANCCWSPAGRNFNENLCRSTCCPSHSCAPFISKPIHAVHSDLCPQSSAGGKQPWKEERSLCK